MSLVVGWISDGTVRSEFLDSIVALVKHQPVTTISMTSGPRIASSRNELVRTFLLKTESEWLLMLDTDMSFDVDLGQRMVSVCERDQIDVLSGLCFSVDDDDRVFPVLYEGSPPVRMKDVPKALTPIEAAGAACLLMSRRALVSMGERGPLPHCWFEETTSDGWEYGEDVTFCLRAKKCGFQPYVDPSISLGHVRTHIISEVDFGPDHDSGNRSGDPVDPVHSPQGVT